MTETVLRIVPTSPGWTPTEAAAAAAAAGLRQLCPGATDVIIRRYPHVVFIDQGSNFEGLRCQACTADLAIEWWHNRMDAASATQFTMLTAPTPCCGIMTSLNDLEYFWPAAFARFELQARNPGRNWLSPEEAATVAAALGISVRQVLGRY